MTKRQSIEMDVSGPSTIDILLFFPVVFFLLVIVVPLGRLADWLGYGEEYYDFLNSMIQKLSGDTDD
jgi:fumarate reductase subunit D